MVNVNCEDNFHELIYLFGGNNMNFKKPEMKAPAFNALDEKELKEIKGGNVGTCLLVGYTCNTKSGGGKIGTCLVVGYSCTTTKGNF